MHSLPACYTSHRKTTHVMLGLAINGEKDFRKKSKHNRGDAEGSQVLNSKLSNLLGDAGNPTIKPGCWGFPDVKAL